MSSSYTVCWVWVRFKTENKSLAVLHILCSVQPHTEPQHGSRILTQLREKLRCKYSLDPKCKPYTAPHGKGEGFMVLHYSLYCEGQLKGCSPLFLPRALARTSITVHYDMKSHYQSWDRPMTFCFMGVFSYNTVSTRQCQGLATVRGRGWCHYRGNIRKPSRHRCLIYSTLNKAIPYCYL